MSKEDKLKELISLAVENGYEIHDLWKETIVNRHFNQNVHWLMLYEKDFAKAIWGEDIVARCIMTIATKDGGEQDFTRTLKAYEYHVQQAVISDDPLEYYWENKP